MAKHAHNHGLEKLTKNQSLVFNTLTEADGPMSAYTILDALRDDGFRAPLQVYRALDKLIELGAIHKLESLNAFVACSQPSCDSHAFIAFTICEDCGSVEEVGDPHLEKQLSKLAKASKFQTKRSTLELHGSCSNCV